MHAIPGMRLNSSHFLNCTPAMCFASHWKHSKVCVDFPLGTFMICICICLFICICVVLMYKYAIQTLRTAIAWLLSNQLDSSHKGYAKYKRIRRSTAKIYRCWSLYNVHSSYTMWLGLLHLLHCRNNEVLCHLHHQKEKQDILQDL